MLAFCQQVIASKFDVMKESTYVQIGKVGRAHGLTGMLKFNIDDRYAEDFLESEVVFVELKGKKVPYFMEDVREGNDLLVKLEDCDSPEQAQALSGNPVFLRAEDLLPESERETSSVVQYERYIGYTIVDTYTGVVGAIQDIIELPQQFMAVVQVADKEVLIPMHPHFLRKIDDTLKEVLMELPEGLLDLN